MRNTLILLAAVGLAHAPTVGWSAELQTPRPPNLIIILTDDQGYGDVGFNGCTDIPTPNLDSIARNGVQCQNGYVTYSVCSPSRAGLLTGRYQQRFGHERNPGWEPGNPGSGLPLGETTLADALGQKGYWSGIIGKWHLGAHPDLHPLKRGFNEFFGFLIGAHHYFPEELTFTNTVDATTIQESRRLWILRNHEPVRTTRYLTDEFSDEAVRFVARNKDRPFFLYLAYNAPHTPLQASEEHLKRVAGIRDPDRRTYAAMVSAVDEGVGRLLGELRKLELERNTLIFYLSDNGGARNNNSTNTPLRGTKGTPWEGGFRVPFAVQWTGHLPAGTRYAPPVSSLDIFATIAALADVPANPDRPLDGVDLIPYFTGQNQGDPHEAIFLRMYDKGAYAVRSGDLKEVIPEQGSEPELYDLAEDVGETANLSVAQPDDLDRLENLRRAWNSQLIAPVFDGEPSRSRKRASSDDNDE